MQSSCKSVFTEVIKAVIHGSTADALSMPRKRMTTPSTRSIGDPLAIHVGSRLLQALRKPLHVPHRLQLNCAQGTSLFWSGKCRHSNTPTWWPPDIRSDRSDIIPLQSNQVNPVRTLKSNSMKLCSNCGPDVPGLQLESGKAQTTHGNTDTVPLLAYRVGLEGTGSPSCNMGSSSPACATASNDAWSAPDPMPTSTFPGNVQGHGNTPSCHSNGSNMFKPSSQPRNNRKPRKLWVWNDAHRSIRE